MPEPAVGPLTRHDTLDDETTAAVLAAADDTALADGSRPLSEQAELRLRHRTAGCTHLLVRGDDGPGRPAPVVGYLQLAAGADGVQGEGFVATSARGRGVARQMAEAVVDDRRPVAVWAHGDHPAADRLAKRFGAVRARELWRMSRSGDEPLPPVTLPEGVRIRAFVPGVDDAAWVALNAAAFASHPEQGAITRVDLTQRMAQDWFDPAGFLLAVEDRDDATSPIRGFHWTKVHAAAQRSRGEVYVVGVSPAQQGRGLGRALTLAGLHHLAGVRVGGQPLADVMLYVDADNKAAVATYRSLGFAVEKVDVQYVWHHSSPAKMEL